MFLTYANSGHRYWFSFNPNDKRCRTALLKQLGKMAADPGVPFTWMDAALVCWIVQKAGA